jgi:hypothetical protein
MRIAFAVFVGYLVMATIVIGTSFGIVFGLGETYQFRDGTLDPAPTVFIAMSAAACLAGLLGGAVTSRVAQSRWPAARVCLVGVILVFGTFSVLGDWKRAQSLAQKVHSTQEIERMSAREKLENANKPMWFAMIAPLIGAVSAAVGCRLGAVATARSAAT